jgi:hypothetical protein
MMKGVLPNLKPQVVIADKLYQFDRRLFGINEMPEPEIRQHARAVATSIASEL